MRTAPPRVGLLVSVWLTENYESSVSRIQSPCPLRRRCLQMPPSPTRDVCVVLATLLRNHDKDDCRCTLLPCPISRSIAAIREDLHAADVFQVSHGLIFSLVQNVVSDVVSCSIIFSRSPVYRLQESGLVVTSEEDVFEPQVPDKTHW